MSRFPRNNNSEDIESDQDLAEEQMVTMTATELQDFIANITKQVKAEVMNEVKSEMISDFKMPKKDFAVKTPFRVDYDRVNKLSYTLKNPEDVRWSEWRSLWVKPEDIRIYQNETYVLADPDNYKLFPGLDEYNRITTGRRDLVLMEGRKEVMDAKQRYFKQRADAMMMSTLRPVNNATMMKTITLEKKNTLKIDE